MEGVACRQLWGFAGSGTVRFRSLDTFARFAVMLKLLTANAVKKFRKVRKQQRALRNCTTTNCQVRRGTIQVDLSSREEKQLAGCFGGRRNKVNQLVHAVAFIFGIQFE